MTIKWKYGTINILSMTNIDNNNNNISTLPSLDNCNRLVVAHQH